MVSPPRLRRVFTTTESRTKTLVALAAVFAVFALATVVLRTGVPGITDPVWIRNRVAAYGRFAPVVFILLQAAQVVLAPVPGQLLAFVGGYLFGPVSGAAYSLLGAALGSTVAFLIARRYGRPYVERVIDAATLDAFDGVVARDGVFALFLVFLVPGLPDDAICFMAGITRLPLRQLVVVSVLGRAPGYLLISYAGSEFARANYLTTTGILIGLAGVAALVYWRKDAVLAARKG